MCQGRSGCIRCKGWSGFAAAVANGATVDVADGVRLATSGVSCPPLVKLGMDTLQAKITSTIASLAIKAHLLVLLFHDFSPR